MDIALVVSNRPNAGGLKRASDANITNICIDHTQYPNRRAFEIALKEVIDSHEVDFLLLAGFMRILTAQFVANYSGKIVNIHPSLLPAYTGLHTHQRALDANDAWHGCSVHFVNAELDGGPIIAQGRVPVQDDDSAESLAARVLVVEHKILPCIANLLAQRSIEYVDGQVHFEQRALHMPLIFDVDSGQIAKPCV